MMTQNMVAGVDVGCEALGASFETVNEFGVPELIFTTLSWVFKLSQND